MSNTLGKVVADFSTTLNLKTAIGATSATLDSATDDDGVALPTGTYFLTLDRKSANKEYIKCTLTSTALTDIYHVSLQGVLTSGTTKTHRKGATVEITDFAIIKKMLDLLDGTNDLNASVPLKYDGTATISNANHLATKAYVDDVAIAGGADASTTVKGISKLSVAPASASNPIAVGDNDGRVPTQDENDALAGTSGTPSTSNKYVTNDDTATAATANKIARRLAGGNITVVTESANNNSTNAASTAYVDTAVGTVPVNIDTLTFTRDSSTASGTQTVNHNLGRTPKGIHFNAISPINITTSGFKYCNGGYDGTTNNCVTNCLTNESTSGVSDSYFFVAYESGIPKGYRGAVTAWDSTTFTVTWTKDSTPTGNIYIFAQLF